MRYRGHARGERGFSLVETMVASGVLTVGLLGVAGVFAKGIQRVGNSPMELIATQKAAEAIESVYTARDSKAHSWSEIRNVRGVSGTDGGIFLDGPQPLKDAGPDGLVGTVDDGSIQRLVGPGPDGLLNTADDEVLELSMFTREIQIRDLTPSLRQIRITVHYANGGGPEVRDFVLVTYISNYA
jgi:type II secretory pathway pseudopilin PulG